MKCEHRAEGGKETCDRTGEYWIYGLIVGERAVCREHAGTHLIQDIGDGPGQKVKWIEPLTVHAEKTNGGDTD